MAKAPATDISTPTRAADRAEAARLETSRAYRALEAAPKPRLERVARLAAGLFGADSAEIVLIDADTIRPRAGFGRALGDRARGDGLFDAVASGDGPIAVPDVRSDRRFARARDNGAFFAAAPLRASDGSVIGALAVHDRKPRKRVEADGLRALADLAELVTDDIARDLEAIRARERVRADAERAELALSAADIAAYEWDFESDALTLQPGLARLLGVASDPRMSGDPEEIARQFTHPDDRDRVVSTSRAAIQGSGRTHLEHRVVRQDDGRVIWVANSAQIVRRADGRARLLIGVIQDITARRIAEDQRETLVAELDHRVKNVLASVQSLAAQSARKAASMDGFLKTFSGRLKSMASAHELLTATRWRGAGMQNIAAAELGGLAPGQTRWEGPDILLNPRAANAMSLALHELATNAVKFGALSADTGRVHVRWGPTADEGMELVWVETGGPPVRQPTRRGFGATLLEKVTGRELDGSVRLEFLREGLRVTVHAAKSALAEAAPDLRPLPPEPETETEPEPLISVPRPDRAVDLHGLRVLIVEDALLLALELEAGLSEAGAEIVGVAGDVGEARRMLDRPLDAAVLDANLNGESVLPVAEALFARGVPFVLATGYGDDRMSTDYFGAPVIRKPYDVTQIAAALAETSGRA